MGVTEYHDATPLHVLVSINGPRLRSLDTLLRSTIAHELGHVVFDAPAWIAVPGEAFVQAASAIQSWPFGAMGSQGSPRQRVHGCTARSGTAHPGRLAASRQAQSIAAVAEALAGDHRGSGHRRLLQSMPKPRRRSCSRSANSTACPATSSACGWPATTCCARRGPSPFTEPFQLEDRPWPLDTWIRARREEADIMLIDFARDINISPAYWSRIERGPREGAEGPAHHLGLRAPGAWHRPGLHRGAATAARHAGGHLRCRVGLPAVQGAYPLIG